MTRHFGCRSCRHTDVKSTRHQPSCQEWSRDIQFQEQGNLAACKTLQPSPNLGGWGYFRLWRGSSAIQSQHWFKLSILSVPITVSLNCCCKYCFTSFTSFVNVFRFYIRKVITVVLNKLFKAMVNGCSTLRVTPI